MKRNVTLVWKGLEFECIYTPGVRGDRENPPEPPDLEILDVRVDDWQAVADAFGSELLDASVETLDDPEEPEHNNDPD